MGTTFSVQTDADEAIAQPAMEAAFAEIARLEQVLSEQIPTSEIARVNANAGKSPVQLSEDGYRVVRSGLDASRYSGGAFDLSWAALRDLYSFRAGEHTGEALDERAVRARLRLIDHEAIILDDAAKTVRMGRGMVIGTGSIAKGYALDRAADVLLRAGIVNFMISGGGQVQVHGTKQGRPWRVGLQHPREADAYFAFIESADGSISTSGDYKHYFFDPAGQRVHHLIDTRTGEPGRMSIAVTMITEQGINADTLSTAVFIMGPERGLAMLATLPYRAEAIIIGPDCKVHVSPSIGARLRFVSEMTPDANGILPRCAGRP